MSSPPPADPYSHLVLLRLLEAHPDYTQRQIAKALGVSLGKTHYLMKALFAKGWVKVQNFQRSNDKLGYVYILTPGGVNHRLQLTQRFLVTKEQEYVSLHQEIVTLRAEVAARSAVALPGDSF